MPRTNTWIPYDVYNAQQPHTVTGNVWVLPRFWSPQLSNQRDILIYLPPSYASSQRSYPVIYMHDGQNLFDANTSYAGEWQVDETMEQLAAHGLEAIVVGIPNAKEQRMFEYAPFPFDHSAGGGERYLAFLKDTLKPRIDRDFRTQPGSASTGLLGSSMGGLISLYGALRYPQIFGLAGVLSPSLWFAGGEIFRFLATHPPRFNKIYLDIGLLEGRRRARLPIASRPVRSMAADARRLHDFLLAAGYQPEITLCYREETNGQHTEAAWAQRLPEALRFLLADTQ